MKAARFISISIFVFSVYLGLVYPSPTYATSGSDNSVAQFGLDERPTNLTCIAPERPPTGASVELEQVLSPGDVPVAMVQAPNDDSRWLIVFISGLVKAYQAGNTFSTLGTFIDIRDRVTTTWTDGSFAEFGLLGIAFHPDFERNGHVFLYYTTPGDPPAIRVSRFTSNDGGMTLDPGSEKVLLSHNLRLQFHVAGNMAFGKDGYLYIGVGDNGRGPNAQNTNVLLGKILRLDVDNGTPYSIPPDNPFASGGGRPEIYAWGFRNPWRFSFDTQTDELWLGDVGFNSWEEVNLVGKGGNYGWPIREGAHCLEINLCSTAGLIDPVVEYSHEGRGLAYVVGGFVYRGTAIPNLRGTYIFGDGGNGEIWAIEYDLQGNPMPKLLLSANKRVMSFAQGNDGELYVLLGGGAAPISRLVKAGEPVPNVFPQKLSDTGCVDPNDPTKPAAGLIPYDVNVPLWSDGAAKERWMALPDWATVDPKIHIGDDGDWEFPIGTVLVKNFRVANKLIETRHMILHNDGEWAGYSYEWNDEQTDATLLPAGKTKVINGQTWSYPSRSQCLQCHTDVAGRSLGPETAQLNGPLTYPSTGRTANQLATLAHIGLFDAELPAAVDELPALPPITDESKPLDLRARAYLHANCSMCHRPDGPGRGPEDFRYTTPGLEIGALNEPPTQGDFGIADARLLLPGHPEKSIISYRIHTLDLGRMPPLGTRLVDPQGTALIDAWIKSGLGFGVPDSDDDEVADNLDNCPNVANGDQADSDDDEIGDACDCDGSDLDNDGDVDGSDLSVLSADFGRTNCNSGPICEGDFDNDNDVDGSDLSVFASHFGKTNCAVLP